jgi:hypothetical protein
MRCLELNHSVPILAVIKAFTCFSSNRKGIE